jgi:hypothetical protein
MALTLEAEQRLRAVGLIKFFADHESDWLSAAKETFQFVKRNFPPNEAVRRDDVAKALSPIIEVDPSLRNELNRNKLKQKYWIADFVDLIVDRTWDRMTEDQE